MAAAAPTRPIAPLPHASSSGHAQPRAPPPRIPLYTPTPDELRPGPANRHILALRSGVPSEVDWALPRLVTASYDHVETFVIGGWLDGASALFEWPQAWLGNLERRAALQIAREGDGKGVGLAIAAMPEWSVDPAIERRATESLLILRNATFNPRNAEFIGRREQTAEYILRFFSLPHTFLLDTLLASPEPFLHLLSVLHATLSHLARTPALLSLLSTTLPRILVDTRDAAILSSLIPLLITALTIPSLPALPPTLPGYLLHVLALSPPGLLLDYTLDLLFALTLTPGPARIVLAEPRISAHLAHLVRLLQHGGVRAPVSFLPPPWTMGSQARNPASRRWAGEHASKRRAIERERVHAAYQVQGRIVANPPLGTKEPSLSDSLRTELLGMKEPERSIKWMHENFVYSTVGAVMQVEFWEAYLRFFKGANIAYPLLAAAELIKNVGTAFPGTGARVEADANGENRRFVIGGLGYRGIAPEESLYLCHWQQCPNPSSASDLSSLTSHLLAHITPDSSTPCRWAHCTQTACTPSHLLTHITRTPGVRVPDVVLSNPRSESWIASPRVTGRSEPRLPPGFTLHYSGVTTSTDAQRQPRGVPFLAALVLRNLARGLRNEMADAGDAGSGVEGDADGVAGLGADAQAKREEKKRHLMAERFGLPIPEGVLREEEEEERAALGARAAGAGLGPGSGSGAGSGVRGDGEPSAMDGLNWLERDRARLGFVRAQQGVGRVVQENLGGLGLFLGDLWGW